jgi:hypothetical protein
VDVPAWLTPEIVEDPVGELKRRATRVVRSVRRRYWFAAAAVLGALLTALALLPSGGHPARPLAVVRTAGPRPVPVQTAPVLPDDPVAALTVLLTARDGCFRDLSVLCLATVDDSSSGAFSSDTAAIQRVQQGGQTTTGSTHGGRPLTLVERLGDTALVRIGDDSEPASVLMIRTEAGWRIRDFLGAAQTTTSPASPVG